VHDAGLRPDTALTSGTVDALLDSREHVVVHRLLPALVAVFVAVFVLASPSVAHAKDGPRPTRPPTPRVQPTPTPTVQPTPTPPPANVEGIDVSYHQGPINWPQVAAAGKGFAFVRASAGTLTADTAYWTNRSGARAAGLAVGSYHFANPDTAPNDAGNEASWFLRNAAIASGDLIPVLDFETANGLDPVSLATWAQTWLTQVTAATGVRPIIYTTPKFWATSMADTDWFARNGYSVLWIAHWTTATEPAVPAGGWGGNGWSLWQYSSTGVVPGISGPVDLDRFSGSSLPISLFVP
jgi:GH25 family lysozyme M1 (1,4-beta-N-acetylmuramidase)